MAQIENAFDDAGSGPPIIFLHGFPFNRSMWREQIAFLSANGFRCLAPDLRGLGEAVAQTSVFDDHNLDTVPPATMAEMALDVAQMMDKLQIERAIICGLSMGCYVAFEFVHLFPSRVSALVLCGPRAQGPDENERLSREAQALRVLAAGMDFAVESISSTLLA